MSDAEAFKRRFSPYTRRYVMGRSGDPKAPAWRTVDRRLTDEMIGRAIRGELCLGYYLSTTPQSFALDVDDHEGRGERYLYSVYDWITKLLGYVGPSVLSRSPRGLHLHYFMSDRLPWEGNRQMNRIPF